MHQIEKKLTDQLNGKNWIFVYIFGLMHVYGVEKQTMHANDFFIFCCFFSIILFSLWVVLLVNVN